jgi:hypothetical protein
VRLTFGATGGDPAIFLSAGPSSRRHAVVEGLPGVMRSSTGALPSGILASGGGGCGAPQAPERRSSTPEDKRDTGEDDKAWTVEEDDGHFVGKS